MAHSQNSKKPSGYWSSQASTKTTPQDSTTSSEYKSSPTNVKTRPLDPHYLCYWLDSCNGQHELKDCNDWRRELGGKLGIYYAPSGDYKEFPEYRTDRVNLENNPTGSTLIHLLIYNDDKKEVLFGLRRCVENKDDPQRRRVLFALALPSKPPRQRNENMSRIPYRIFQWLTTDTNFANQCLEQGLQNRFLFQNANVIYPVHLTNEQASKLTENFRPNQEFQSIHWVSLSNILSQLPPWSNYIIRQKTNDDIAHIQHIKPTGIKVEKHDLWSVTVTCLMCIREHVPGGLDTFLAI